MYADRIYADFQNLDDENRVRLTCAGTVADLAKMGTTLVEGMPIPLYTDDEDEAGKFDPLFLEGIVELNVAEGCWVARVDWNSIRHESEEVSDFEPEFYAELERRIDISDKHPDQLIDGERAIHEIQTYLDRKN